MWITAKLRATDIRYDVFFKREIVIMLVLSFSSQRGQTGVPLALDKDLYCHPTSVISPTCFLLITEASCLL